MKIKQRIIFCSLFLAIFSFDVDKSKAAGFETDLTSTSALANSYAGSATGSHDISDSFFNPAILSNVKSTTLILSASMIRLNIDADNSSGKTSSGSSVSDGGISDAGIDSVVPAFYFATPINKETTFGFAVTSPYGLATKYDKAWAGRYQAIDSAITTVNFNPTISYKIDPKLSVGAGLQAQYMSATLTNMVDYGSALGAAGSDDRLAKINGTDWGYGYNFGVNYKFNDKTKFGIGYRSKIDHKLEGRAEVNGLQYGNFNSSVTTPESVDAGISYQINKDNELVADVLWSRWSRLKSLNIYSENSNLNNNVAFNWHDSFRYSLGYNLKASEKLIIRSGAAYEKDAINNKNRSPSVPTGNRIWLSGGFGYKITNQATVDMSYMHQFYRKTQSDIAAVPANVGVSPGTPGLTTSYKTHVDTISIGLKYEF